MKALNTILLFFLTQCITLSFLNAQVVTVDPPVFTLKDSITITFDATQGNGALAGTSPIYVHTGMITAQSVHDGDWKYRKVPWAQPADSQIVMMDQGNNTHKLGINIPEFYYVGSNEDVRAMAFVFRNGDGSIVGKNADGSDIHIYVMDTLFDAQFTKPLAPMYKAYVGEILPVSVISNEDAFISIYKDGNLIAQTISGKTVAGSVSFAQAGTGWLHFEAVHGNTTITDSCFYVVPEPPLVLNLPPGVRDGINYLDDSTVVFQLFAPNKDHVYLIGDFNNWQIHPEYSMNKTPDGTRWWYELTGLTPGKEYRFQYFVDAEIRVTDPYCEKVLDQWNDVGINNVVYPDLIPYPKDTTYEIVGVFQTAQDPYAWEVTNFQQPDNRDLVIYELLVRDFVIRHDWATVIDSLDYLQRLGVNAIELMPFNEFDGNDNWGYGPAFFFAPDKFYGTKNALKKFVDECHKRDIAVIQDIVFNHAFSQNPWVRLYYDDNTGKASPDNPWFNVEIPHPFGLGFDFDHSTPETQYFVDSCLSFWVEEYNIDGYRLDLTKGFTNKWTMGDIGAWSAYDADRIGYIKRLSTRFWDRHPGRYIILEHLGDNSEETELANHGCMLWGKGTTQYAQSAMGWSDNSNFAWQMSYQDRGWSFHNLVGFMESHDEQRLMYECMEFGNTFGNYSTKDLETALTRMGSAAAFFWTIPGPKMMWMFGELGYDFDINFNGRTGKKPIKWNYYQEADRHRLFKTYAALTKLKTENPAFRTSDYFLFVDGLQKQIHLNDPSMDVRVFGNFDMVDRDVWTGFSQTGTWYDYMTGQSMEVTDVDMLYNLQPGEWKIYTTVQLPVPDMTIPDFGDPTDGVATMPEEDHFSINVYPNPFGYQTHIRFHLDQPSQTIIQVFNVLGEKVRTLDTGTMAKGQHQVKWDGRNDNGQLLPQGMYTITIHANGRSQSQAVLFMP